MSRDRVPQPVVHVGLKLCTAVFLVSLGDGYAVAALNTSTAMQSA